MFQKFDLISKVVGDRQMERQTDRHIIIIIIIIIIILLLLLSLYAEITLHEPTAGSQGGQG